MEDHLKKLKADLKVLINKLIRERRFIGEWLQDISTGNIFEITKVVRDFDRIPVEFSVKCIRQVTSDVPTIIRCPVSSEKKGCYKFFYKNDPNVLLAEF